MSKHEQTRLITFQQLKPEKGIGYTRMQLHRRMNEGTFPQAVRLSSKRIAWLEHEVDRWIVSLPRRPAGTE
jgi:predicted DNA-binding transcriptional regulator AlpA